jgi:7 transmembrane receptor (Secretin family)
MEPGREKISLYIFLILSYLCTSHAYRRCRKIKFTKSSLIFMCTYFLLQTGCVLLHLILHYFLLTCYAWMLCEGFYLHTVLVSAFISEQKLVRWLILIGWSAPAPFVILYGALRGYVSEDNDRVL